MSEPQQPRRINRTLTQKYDMHALRILQKLETELMQEFAALFGCDEDEVELELDLLRVYNSDVAARKQELEEMFAGVPGDVAATVEKVLKRMEELDESHNHSNSTSSH